MANELRVVFDTNALISAVLLPNSVPRRTLDVAVAKGRLLISQPTIAELTDVLGRSKFDRYVSEIERAQFLVALVRDAELVEIHEAISACRDPTDDKFLELAISGAASHIVSGDPDLLALDPFRMVRIVTPQEFLTQMGKSP